MPISLLKLVPTVEALTPDAELLSRFTSSRDEAAFEELVRRHGPTVYRVCRRLAPTFADDAFQTVFITLACRAQSVQKPGAVGSWLIGVAGRVARQMRKAEQRRVAHERIAGRDEVGCGPSADLAELAAVLEDELTRLPDKFRDPVVLCLVQGRTHAQTAAELGGSVRTLRRRLERAKALLQARLESRGLVPAVAAALVAGMGETAWAIPPGLARCVVSNVFQFLNGGAIATPPIMYAKGVMGMAKLKVSALMATAAIALVCLGVGWSREGSPPAPSEPLSPLTRMTDTREGVPHTPASAPATQPPTQPPVAIAQPAEPVGIQFRGPNFVVHAPTQVMARVIASEAEYHRQTLALKWFGEELPNWPKPCVIRFTSGLGGNGGAGSFTFGKNADGKQVMRTAEMELRGDFMATLTSTLPHEVMHALLASHFGKPIPRWADEGVAVLCESEYEQANHDAKLRELLSAGRGLRLKVLLPLGEYPKDMMALYTQGHSVVRFLVHQSGPVGVPLLKDIPHVGGLFKNGGADRHQRLLAFLHLGMKENKAESWRKAAKEVYGFESVDALEEAWLEWLSKPESVLTRKVGGKPALTPAKSGATDLIPPVKLPTAPPTPKVPDPSLPPTPRP